MKIISVSNQKGGCGKTTTTINLAGALAQLGKKILVVDLDPQAHATFGLGASNHPSNKSIYHVLTDHPEKRRPIAECIVPAFKGLDIVPSNILLSTLEQELKDKEDAVSKLHNILSTSGLDYDYAIIDCPPSLGFLTFNSLRAAELIVVPIDMSAFSLMGVGKLLGMLELIKVKINHAPQVKALATLFDRRTKYSVTMLDEIKSFFRDQMLETVIRVSVALKKAAFSGVPVVSLDPASNGSLDHLALAREILKFEGDLDFELALTSAAPERAPAENPVPQESPVSPTQFTLAERPAAESMIENNAPEAQTQTSPVDDPAQTTSAEKETLFFLNLPQAKDVFVVGEFNHWKANEDSRLSRLENGLWEKRLALAPGKYRYKFIIDGEWMLDVKNTEREQNAYGTYDSILQV